MGSDRENDLERQADKSGKVPFELVDLGFIASMALQLGAGLRKAGRVPDGWRKLEPARWIPKYRAALFRHFAAAEKPGAVDPETGQTHYAGVAVNAMICAVLERGLAVIETASPEWLRSVQETRRTLEPEPAPAEAPLARCQPVCAVCGYDETCAECTFAPGIQRRDGKPEDDDEDPFWNRVDAVIEARDSQGVGPDDFPGSDY